MKEDLRQRRPFLAIGIVLVLVGVAIIFFGIMYPDRGNWLGGMVAGFWSTAFIVIGLYACLFKEKRGIKFFCSKCGKKIFSEMDENMKETTTLAEAERTCICSDCDLLEIAMTKKLKIWRLKCQSRLR